MLTKRNRKILFPRKRERDERAMQKDNVNHPSHYTQGGIECIDAIKAATVGLTGIEAVCTGNAVKYMWRWKFKNGAEDIRKAMWYLEKLLEEVESENSNRRR